MWLLFIVLVNWVLMVLFGEDFYVVLLNIIEGIVWVLFYELEVFYD